MFQEISGPYNSRLLKAIFFIDLLYILKNITFVCYVIKLLTLNKHSFQILIKKGSDTEVSGKKFVIATWSSWEIETRKRVRNFWKMGGKMGMTGRKYRKGSFQHMFAHLRSFIWVPKTQTYWLSRSCRLHPTQQCNWELWCLCLANWLLLPWECNTIRKNWIPDNCKVYLIIGDKIGGASLLRCLLTDFLAD